MIGFDATEDHRTYATGGAADVCPSPGLPRYGERYNMRYPLREWGFDRQACGKIIVDAGLPLPPKSACFYCPSAKVTEIEDLARTEPDYWRMAIYMENRYRAGRHFRGDQTWIVTAKRADTGEIEKHEMSGESVPVVRAEFRIRFNDTTRPYRYKLSIKPCVVGLGRSQQWSRLALTVL